MRYFRKFQVFDARSQNMLRYDMQKKKTLSGYFTKNCQTVTITQSPLSLLHTFACSCSYKADDSSFSY